MKRYVLVALVTLAGAACHRAPMPDAKQLVQEGDRLAAAGKQKEAILLYRQAVKQDPKSADAHVRLGDAYLKANELGGALHERVVTADLMPENVEAQLKAGEMLVSARRVDDAR